MDFSEKKNSRKKILDFSKKKFSKRKSLKNPYFSKKKKRFPKKILKNL